MSSTPLGCGPLYRVFDKAKIPNKFAKSQNFPPQEDFCEKLSIRMARNGRKKGPVNEEGKTTKKRRTFDVSQDTNVEVLPAVAPAIHQPIPSQVP
jgi:hypothetical protein